MEALHIHYSVQETECCKVSRDLWVIAQRELTSDYGGSDRSLLRFLLLLSTRFLFCLLGRSVHLLGNHTENPRLYHSCRVVRRPVMGVLAWLQTGMTDSSCLLCHCGAWPRTAMPGGGEGFPCVTALLGPQWDLRGKWSEECGRRRRRRGGAQRLADLQITHGKKQIGLIWEHARTCAPGKGTPALLLQTESVNTVTQHY